MGLTGDIFSKYAALCDYCEKFWQSVSKKYPKDIACHAGCGICCELQSVNLLEAYSIYNVLRLNEKKMETEQKSSCVFLLNDTCSIYSARPIICRTHGLVIKSVEFTSSFSITCSYNFHYTDDVPHDAILDIDLITKNLIRLNYAFCMVIGKKQIASERIELSQIASGKLPIEIQNAFEKL